jgi:hypothetical protein
MRAAYGKSLRSFFSNFTNPIQLIDFAGQQIFDATVDTNILLLSKSANQQATNAISIKDKDSIANMGVFVKQNSVTIPFATSDSWTILSPIEESIKAKIEAIGTPLKEWNIQINYGIKTGYNEAFIISGEKRRELIKQDPKSEEIIRPILRGKDIKRYGYNFANLWLITAHNGIKEKGIKPVNINDYPAIKNHLDNYWNKIAKRTDQGDTPYNLRSCSYMEDFYKQKIVYPCIMTSEPFFMFDNDGIFFTPAPGNIITGNHLQYLLTFLCSKTCYFALRKYYMGGGIEGELKTNRLLILPIPLPNILTENKIIKLLELKQFCEIDKLIYQIYMLTDEEINFISSSVN